MDFISGGFTALPKNSRTAPRSRTLICSTISSSGTRSISGSVYARSFSAVCDEKRWYAVPARTRPARPRRCFALAMDTNVSTSAAIRFPLSYRFSFTRPESTTHTASVIVMEVSAMLVEITILRTPGGGISNTRRCSSVVRVEWHGKTRHRSGSPNVERSEMSISYSVVISRMPGIKTRIAPSSVEASSAIRSS